MSRVRRALVMASLEQYLGLLLNFLLIAAVARILSPSEIGLAVVGMGISVIVFSFREFATAEFLVQRDTVTREDIRTSFTVLTFVTAILAAALLAALPLLSRFYGEAGLAPFLAVMVLAAVIETLSLQAIALLRREMAFGVLARIRTVSLGMMVVTTVALAALGFGFMSYAWGTLAASLVTATLSVYNRAGSLSFHPSLASWRHIVEFGRYRGANDMVDRLYGALPQLVLGRFMPMASVGIYNRANAVCTIPDRMLLGAVFAVAFPALSESVRQGLDVRKSYVRALCLITGLHWPALIVLAILAQPAVDVILGANWQETVPLVRIMSLAALFFFPVIITIPMLMALGKYREAFSNNLVGRAFAAIVLCSASVFGLKAMALSMFVALPFQMALSFYYARRHVDFRWAELLAGLAKSAAVGVSTGAGAMIVVAWAGFRFDLTFAQACLAAAMAAAGWLVGAVLAHHPILDEMRHVVPLPGPLARFRPAASVGTG